MSIVSNNIKYLRRLNGLTQEQFSRRLGIKRSLVGAYEEARANPPLENLKLIANTFGVSVDALIKQDIRKLKTTPDVVFDFESRASTYNQAPVQVNSVADVPKSIGEIIQRNLPQNSTPQAPSYIPQPSSFTKSNITHTNRVAQRITLKPIEKANNYHFNTGNKPFASPNYGSASQSVSFRVIEKRFQQEYQNRFQDIGFIQSMPLIQMPKLSPNTEYRAFEAGNDFAIEGAYMIGKAVDNWINIIDGKYYIIVVRGKGVLYRKIINQIKVKGTLLLMADNASIPSEEIFMKDMVEVWEFTSYISYTTPEPQVSFEKLGNLVDELKFEIERLRR